MRCGRASNRQASETFLDGFSHAVGARLLRVLNEMLNVEMMARDQGCLEPVERQGKRHTGDRDGADAGAAIVSVEPFRQRRRRGLDPVDDDLPDAPDFGHLPSAKGVGRDDKLEDRRRAERILKGIHDWRKMPRGLGLHLDVTFEGFDAGMVQGEELAGDCEGNLDRKGVLLILGPPHARARRLVALFEMLHDGLAHVAFIEGQHGGAPAFSQRARPTRPQ